jgi:hypothetical protein
MALAQGNLGNITHIGAGASTAVVTVGSAKTVYVRALEIHSLDPSNTANVQVHVVPNNGGSTGTASSITRIARLGISTEDTYFFENAYPITLTANGDSIIVVNENANDSVNVLVLGDKEA